MNYPNKKDKEGDMNVKNHSTKRFYKFISGLLRSSRTNLTDDVGQQQPSGKCKANSSHWWRNEVYDAELLKFVPLFGMYVMDLEYMKQNKLHSRLEMKRR